MVGTGEAVDALGHAPSMSSHHRRAKSSKRKQFSREPSNRRRCGYCGGQHGAARESCPAYNKQCRKCTKLHHFEKQCRSTQFGPSSQNRQVCNVDNEEELLALKNGDNVRAYCNLDINGKSVNFMLDCGASCNVLLCADAIVVNRKSADLKPPKSRLSMYNRTELKTLGMLTAEWCIHDWETLSDGFLCCCYTRSRYTRNQGMQSDGSNIHKHAEHIRRERNANVVDRSAVVATDAYKGFYHLTLCQSLRWHRFA